MQPRFPVRVTRRRALAGGVGAAALLTTARRVSAQRSAVGGGGGIAGGGTIETANGPIHFSLFGSRLMLEDESEPAIFGSLRWVDEDGGWTFESTSIANYGPPADDEDARELRGTVAANGGDEYPFVLRAVDIGAPGAGEDTIRLTVGEGAIDATPPAAAPSSALAYEVEGPLAAGDIQLLSFDPGDEG